MWRGSIADADADCTHCTHTEHGHKPAAALFHTWPGTKGVAPMIDW